MLAAGASFGPGGGATFINPLVGMYRTKGGGSLVLTMLQGYPYWADTVSAMGRPELADDPRFSTAVAFAKNHAEVRGPAGDLQVEANDYLIEVDAGDGRTFALVASPVQFDEIPPNLRKGPEQGQHIEEVMLELGLDWERIAQLKALGVIN